MTRPPPAKTWSGRKLQEFRKRLGLSIMEVARQGFLEHRQVTLFESGRTTPCHPALHGLIRALGLDLFDLDELLRLGNIPARHLQKFRVACRLDGKTPMEALRDFVMVYPGLVKEKLRDRQRADGNTGEDNR